MKKFFNLQKFREDRNITQEALADKLGITQTDISNYENDITSMPFGIILKIIDFFDIKSLDEILNDEAKLLPAVSMENIYSPLRIRTTQYIEKIKSLANKLSAQENLDVYITGFFLPDKIIFPALAKPTLSFIDISDNQVEKNNILANILGSNQIIDSDIPVFYVHKDSRPEWAQSQTNPKTKEKMQNWLDKDILFFRKSITGYFDIKSLYCLEYASYLDNFSGSPLLDLFLNTQNENDADCAVVFLESDLLHNTNILSLSKNMEQFDSYHDISDICVLVGKETDLIKKDIKYYNAHDVLKVTIGYVISDSNEEEIYSYNLFSEKANKKFNADIKEYIISYIDNLNQNSEKTVSKGLEQLKLSFQNNISSKIVESDVNLIKSKLQNYSNELKIDILKNKDNTRKDFGKIFTEITDTKNIESILKELGEEIYKKAEEKDCFPCNRKDLKIAKETLFDIFIDKVHEMFTEQLGTAVKNSIEITQKYRQEDGLEGLKSFEDGLQQSYTEITSNDEEALETSRQAASFFISTANFKTKGWDENTEGPLSEIYDSSFENITTFARGFSLSKARKISRALTSKKDEYAQVLDDFWENLSLHYEKCIKLSFNDELLKSLPRNEKELENWNKQFQSNIKIIDELLKTPEKNTKKKK